MEEREAAVKVDVGFGTPQKVVRGKEVRTDNRSSSQNLSALSFPPSPSLLPPRKKCAPTNVTFGDLAAMAAAAAAAACGVVI